MIELDPTKLFEQAKKYWYSIYALIIAQVLTLLLASIVISVINPEIKYKIIIYFVLFFITLSLWIYTNQIPKTKKGKIGFLISINTGEESQRIRIFEDFILVLQELIKGGDSGRNFQVIVLPEYIAEKIVDDDAAQYYKMKCRAHFMIYGRIRLRTIAGKEENLINLEGIVSHTPLEKNTSDQIIREFSELLPRRMRIAIE